MDHKSTQLHHKKSYSPVNETPVQPEFPNARYFQIHFEHLQSQLSENKHCMEQLQQQMTRLYLRLALLRPEMINTKEDK